MLGSRPNLPEVDRRCAQLQEALGTPQEERIWPIWATLPEAGGALGHYMGPNAGSMLNNWEPLGPDFERVLATLPRARIPALVTALAGTRHAAGHGTHVHGAAHTHTCVHTRLADDTLPRGEFARVGVERGAVGEE